MMTIDLQIREDDDFAHHHFEIFIDLQTSFKDNGLNQRTIKTTSMQIILNLTPFFTKMK